MEIPAAEILELLPEPAVFLSSRGQILSANPAFCELVSLARQEVEGRDFAGFCADATGLGSFLASVSGVAQPLIGRVTLKGPGDGHRLRCYGASVGAASGTRLLFLRFQPGEAASRQFLALNEQIGALEHEVAQRRRVEQSVRELASIVESSEDAIISKDLNGRITSWNAAAERMFGYTAEEALGQPSLILLPPGKVEEQTAVLGRVLQGERLNHFETVRRRKDGVVLDVSLTVSPMKDEAGHIIGTSKIARDITRQKQMERALAEARDELRCYADQLEQRVEERTARLQESVRSLDGFCYTIAHDLRAPLRAMTGFSLELLEHYGGVLGEEGCDFARRIKQAGLRMDRLITDLLEYGRLNTIDIPVTRLELEPLLGEVLTELEQHVRRGGAEVRVKKPLAPVLGNAVVFRQILTNLVGNALKFVPADKPAKVEIWTENGGQRTRLLVKDNGIGIKEKYRDRLFEPFVRLVRQDEYPGTGIGLAIVRKAAERMGGRAGCESGQDGGTVFWVEVPSPVGGATEAPSHPMHCQV